MNKFNPSTHSNIKEKKKNYKEKKRYKCTEKQEKNKYMLKVTIKKITTKKRKSNRIYMTSTCVNHKHHNSSSKKIKNKNNNKNIQTDKLR
jgi:hypothetical protein